MENRTKKKMGRPTDAPKSFAKKVRMSEEDVLKLAKCCTALKKTESDIIRMGINIIYQNIRKDED